ncbi:MAG TPA: DtxR family transcriptional regulator [Lachnospiraceae bacterium]|nr:DtxR family transcriptional regulator [Lachnospiraceae bacterium]
MPLQESGEMYLETIYVLSLTSDSVRGIDIGDHLGYSKPSVSRALGLLKEKGLVTKTEEGYIRLTNDGERIAKRIYERHTLLTKLFISLGVDEKTATDDACRIEHYISDKTFNAVKNCIEKKNPSFLRLP